MLAGVVNISMATLATLSVLGVGLAGYYNLVIRDAAINAASQAARYGAADQSEYLVQRLDLSLPHLAKFSVSGNRQAELTHITVDYQIPGLGLLGDFANGRISVAAATERI